MKGYRNGLKYDLLLDGGPYGDCTCNYTVYVEQPMTVREFLNEVLKVKEEWGDISIKGGNCYSKEHCVEYEHGKVTNNWMTEEDMNTLIDGGKANGGWSLMSYRLSVVE